MVKNTSSGSPSKSRSKNSNTTNGIIQIVEEKSTKPPISGRFSRKLQTDESESLKLNNSAFYGTGTLTSGNKTSSIRRSLSVNDNGGSTLLDFCQQLLVEGYVQSYIDFYHLTHRADPHNIAEQERGGALQIQISMEDMVFIRDNLVKAEVCRRQGDTTSVYAAFTELADFYVKIQDWKTCFFFHEKCLEVAQLTNDVRAEMKANHALGSTYQLMNDYDGARKYHERHEDIATSVDVFEEIAVANVELFKVYMVLAERLENNKHVDDALQMYQRCLAAAKKSWDRAAEGEANGRIGALLLARGEAQESLAYLRSQSQIAADLGHAEGRCRACSALSLALDSLGQADKALAELTLVHSISEQAGDMLLQAQACRALGTLYSKVGKLEAAVDILQRHFNLVKTILYRSNAVGGGPTTGTTTASKTDTTSEAALGSTKGALTAKDLDLARVYIGISRGNLLLGSYSCALQEDLGALLDWKLNRSELPNLS
mmetsp:Transcript_21238/g.29220  ORF Transcript_21238/g.29220 Transcript_21238/m.29220 type:complete len:487 (+) Transcript_21238:23-1483(+)